MNTYKLIHNINEAQYEYHIDGHISKVEYREVGNGDLILTHTEVPKQMRKRGIASSLMEDILKSIEQKKVRIMPLCPFVVWYIEQHPKWKHLTTHKVSI